MIGKAKFGRNFAGLIGYISEEGHRERVTGYFIQSGHRLGPVYYANLAAQTPEAATREMRFMAKLSRRVEKPVLHLMISLHESESKHDDPKEQKRLAQAASRVLAKLGLSEHQAVYAVHLEKKHMHCHICINRVGLDGKAWPMWRSGERIKAACRAVELEMGYTPHSVFQMRAEQKTAQRQTKIQRGPAEWTARQLRAYEKSGATPTRSVAPVKVQRVRIADEFRPAVRRLVADAASWEDALKNLRQHGFEFAIYRNSSRRGLQIVRADGTRVAASAIDTEFSLLNLERRWGRFNVDIAQPAPIRRSKEPPAQRDSAGWPEIPEQIRDAHRRLWPVYTREIQPTADEKNRLLAELQVSETAEVAGLTATFESEVCAVREFGLSRSGRAFMKSRIAFECRNAILGVRDKYRKKRNEIKKQYRVKAWIDFLIDKVQSLVQDAVTILAWLRRHLDRRTMENGLIAATGVKTPPELFEHEGLSASVDAETGAVVYKDSSGRVAFTDRGNDIWVETHGDGRPEIRHIGEALEHADAKWGASEAVGTWLFKQYAIDVASAGKYRGAQLINRLKTVVAYDFVNRTRNAKKDRPGTRFYGESIPKRDGEETQRDRK